MSTELDRIAALVDASDMVALFGPIDGPAAARKERVTANYRAAVKVVHPDRFAESDLAERATAVFRALTTLRDRALSDDPHGKAPAADAAPAAPVVVDTGKRRYTVGARLAAGDYADLYACTWTEGGAELEGIFKLPRSSGDNDLAENEAKTLAKLYPAGVAEEKFYRYLPRVVDAFELREKGRRRRVVVFRRYAEHVSLEAVRAAYPVGLDFRDVVWMFKRTLDALGFVHKSGFVHGAVIPPHVLVHPTEHGARLVDWSAATPIGGRVKVVSRRYRALYAPEVLATIATPATDIYMAAACAVELLGGEVVGATGLAIPLRVPAPIRAFFSSCLIPAPHRRPDNAWTLHEDFVALLQRVVGKPKYRPLRMPGTTTGE